MRGKPLLAGLAAVALAAAATAAHAQEPLPSWNDGGPKKAIVEFVAKVIRALRTEQPMYFRLAFALDRVKTLAPQHPEWQDRGQRHQDEIRGGRGAEACAFARA